MRGGKRVGAGRKTKWTFGKRLGLVNSATMLMQEQQVKTLKKAVREIVRRELDQEAKCSPTEYRQKLKKRTDKYYDQIRVEKRMKRGNIEILKEMPREGILGQLPEFWKV